MKPQLLSISQAARLIGMSRQAVFLAVNRGTLASERHGPYRLIQKSEAIRYKRDRHAGFVALSERAR